jgi:hypothetical protein
LLDHAEEAARALGCPHITLVTKNDNVDAIRIYQRRGDRITFIDSSAVDRVRSPLASIKKSSRTLHPQRTRR